MANRFGTKYDFAGKIINKLRVEEYVGKSKWRCTCLECGATTYKESKQLETKRAYSCGCCNSKTDEDLTGQSFGKLIANRRVRGKDGRMLWECECSCGSGKHVYARATELLAGKYKSCGCEQHRNRAKNLIGQTFGELTVIDRAPNSSDGKAVWVCRCSCGNIVNKKGTKLKNTPNITCRGTNHGHIYEDLTGNEYGYLKVIEYAYSTSDRKSMWRCKCNNCGRETIVLGDSLKNGLTKSCGCINVTHKGSETENNIKDFVESFGYEVSKERRILDGKEIDIYIPELKLGIEYNGSAVHASVNNAFADKPRMYHQQKFLTAKEKGIHLISIFDVDWSNNQSKIKMYLKSLLQPQKRLMARKCELKTVEEEIACDFVDKYHLQGANRTTMKINYGLYYNDELIAVMSFGKLRLQITNEGQYELHRYAVKDGYTVVGGANKLLKAFERDYKPKYILSYSDNDYFLGGIYERLGFNNSGQSYPRYYWFKNGIELKREACQLKRLKVKYPELYQEAIDNNMSNKEDYVMVKLGYCKVFRSGNTKWEKVLTTE